MGELKNHIRKLDLPSLSRKGEYKTSSIKGVENTEHIDKDYFRTTNYGMNEIWK